MKLSKQLAFSGVLALASVLVFVSAAGAGSSYHRSSIGHAAVLGLELTQITPELRDHYGVDGDEGALVSRVEAGSAAAEAGIEVGDVLLTLDGWSVDSPGDASRQLRWADPGDTIEAGLSRDGRRFEAAVTIGEDFDRGRHHRSSWNDDHHWEYDVDLDAEELAELERRLERFEGQMEQMGERLGRQVEAAVESVDWDDLERDLERELEALEGLDEIIETSLSASLAVLEGLDIELDFDADGLESDLEALEWEIERMVEELIDEIDVDDEHFHRGSRD